MDKTEHSLTYGEVVFRWEEERKSLGVVQPYTAPRAAQKARLLLPWIGSEIVDEIDPLDIGAAMGSLGQTGGRFGKGLSSATLRPVHLAGTMASMNAFEHWWRSWADDHGWVGLRFHELRRTHATLMLSGGTDVKTLQVRLGHSSADITMS